MENAHFTIGKNMLFLCQQEKTCRVKGYICSSSSFLVRDERSGAVRVGKTARAAQKWRGGKMDGNESMEGGIVGKVAGRDVDGILSSIIKWRQAKGGRWMFEVD